MSKIKVKLGYINACEALKALSKRFNNDKDKAQYELLKDIINDFEYCIGKTEKCEKFEDFLNREDIKKWREGK